MPTHVARLVEDALAEKGRDLHGSTIAVLGFSYLENSDDVRDSPSTPLVAYLRESGANVVVHDPWVHGMNGDVAAALNAADAAVVMVAHDAYRALDLAVVAKA